jgi:hypothetical protein
MNTATSYLFQFGSTKEEINKFTEQVQAEVINGEVDPYKFQGIINALVKGLQGALEHNLANLDTTQKHEAYGFKFAPKEAGTRYVFDNCNHPEWHKLNNTLLQVSNAKKEIESTLKSITKPLTIIDEVTGEVVEVFPPQKLSKTIIEVR